MAKTKEEIKKQRREHRKWKYANDPEYKKRQNECSLKCRHKKREHYKQVQKKRGSTEEHKAKERVRFKEKRKNDQSFRLAGNLRSRIRAVLKEIDKSDTTLNLLGCSLEDFKHYLESRFQLEMTWDNYGYGDDKWHIDHITPCDSFDLTKEEEQRKCFHFSNLQPLWQRDNLRKSNKIIY